MSKTRDKANTPQTNFSSTGIDDNATSTAVTLDSSGNVLVGKTTTDFGTVGNLIDADGNINITRDSNVGLNVNRLTNDGNIGVFYKDGTTVGSIGVDGNTLSIDGASSRSGIRFANAIIQPRQDGAIADNTVDLASSLHRFKDAYLGGSVYLGGTGSANALSDYEEGTWSPQYTATGGSITATTTAHASYVKVGNMVYIQCKVATYQSSLTGDLTITGLPFTSSSVSNKHNAFAIGRWYGWNTDMPNLQVINDPNTSFLKLFKGKTNDSGRTTVKGSDTANGVNQSNLVIMGCYQVD